ncbi:hypothetical protein CLOP_g9564 [Closterium sp. NIES-67]|nr:hypothetical protein CLOP_g9564 [Closterium sp. NIES-67]
MPQGEEALIKKMKALGVQLEETRKELEEAERRREVNLSKLRGGAFNREKEVEAGEGEAAELRGELGAVKRALAEQKSYLLKMQEDRIAAGREVKELREALDIVQDENEQRKKDSAGVKGELAAVKGELTELKTYLLKMEGGPTQRMKAEVDEAPPGLSQEVADEEWQRLATAGKIELEELRKGKPNQKETWERFQYAAKEATLDLDELSHVSDAILAFACTLTNLKSLHLGEFSDYSVDCIKYAYRLPRLENLTLPNVQDNALVGIGAASLLKTLALPKSKVTDVGLLHLTGLSSLTGLWLSSCIHVTSAGMVHVGRLTTLEKLFLDGTKVKDDGLQHLTSLTKLRIFTAPYMVTDIGMEHMKHFTALVKLEMSIPSVTEKGVRCLKCLPHLKEITTDVDCMLQFETTLSRVTVRTLPLY